jgi:hypothetical protein
MKFVTGILHKKFTKWRQYRETESWTPALDLQMYMNFSLAIFFDRVGWKFLEKIYMYYGWIGLEKLCEISAIKSVPYLMQ